MYQNKYINFFYSYGFEINSLKEAKKLLRDLAKPSSSFYDFLQTVQQQTHVLSQPILSVTVLEELNEFGFLDSLLQQKEGKPPLVQYQKLMHQLAEELENSPLDSSASSHLLSHLPPAARLSLAIFQDKSDSYAIRMQQCLDQMEIPQRFHPFFNKPLLLIYELGLQELKQTIENLWSSEFHPKVEALFSKFPFNPKGTAVATFAEVEETFAVQRLNSQEFLDGGIEYVVNAKHMFNGTALQATNWMGDFAGVPVQEMNIFSLMKEKYGQGKDLQFDVDGVVMGICIYQSASGIRQLFPKAKVNVIADACTHLVYAPLGIEDETMGNDVAKRMCQQIGINYLTMKEYLGK